MLRYGKIKFGCLIDPLNTVIESEDGVSDIYGWNTYNCCQKGSRNTLFFGHFWPYRRALWPPATTAAARHDGQPHRESQPYSHREGALI